MIVEFFLAMAKLNEKSLEKIIEQTRESGPKELGTRLSIKDAEFVVSRLQNEGMDIEVYDFLYIYGIWKSKNSEGTYFAHIATKRLIEVLAKEIGVDYKTIEGFREMLPYLTTDVFQKKPINIWGTTLGGMLQKAYRGSPADSILDLIAHDSDFLAIKEAGLERYDFRAQNIWIGKDRKPSDLARKATKKLIEVLAKEIDVDYQTVEGFRKILPYLTAETFKTKPINIWGTTLGGMLQRAYRDGPADAILELLAYDKDFSRIRKIFNNRDVLSGLTKTRIDRSRGNYSLIILGNALTQGGFQLADYGFFSFSKGEKKTVRELLAEEASAYFGGRRIAYFGLEGPTFGSYFELAKFLQIDVSQSLIPEREERNYNVMSQIKKLNKVNTILNGNSLRNIKLYLGDAEEALSTTDKYFDLVFLDWLGHLSPARIRELDLAHSKLNAGGMIAVTLRTRKIDESRFKNHTGFSISQTEFMTDWATRSEFTYQTLDYVGGDKKKTPMTLYILRSSS